MANKGSLFDRLKLLSDQAWNRANRRYKPYDRVSNKIDYYLSRNGLENLTPAQIAYNEKMINEAKPDYIKFGDAYEEASNLAERLEDLKLNEQMRRK